MPIQTFQNADITVLLDGLEKDPDFDTLVVPYENTFYSIHYGGGKKFFFFERFGDDDDEDVTCDASEIVERFGGRPVYHSIISDKIKKNWREEYEENFGQKYALRA